MSINFEKILLFILHSLIVFGYPMITLYCMSQFYTNDRIENIKKKKTNYLVNMSRCLTQLHRNYNVINL